MHAFRPIGILTALLALAAAGCATSGPPVPRPFPGGPVVMAPDAPPPNVGEPALPPLSPDLRARQFDGRALAQFALGFRGVPYRLGGADPGGFDCSGLVQYVFAQYGLAVPRVVEQQWEVGEKVKPKEIRAGDLIFFDTDRGRSVSHVAIAISRDSFVHAPNSSGVVRVETLHSNYWGSRYVGARRVAGETHIGRLTDGQIGRLGE